MNPNFKQLCKFYMTLKVHRPFISGYVSIPKYIAVYVEHHLKHIATKHSTYIQDTPDFFRKIDLINNGQFLPKNAMLVTIDAIGPNTNMPQEDWLECISEALVKKKQTIPSNFYKKIIALFLKQNLFEFNSQTGRQVDQTAKLQIFIEPR